MITIRPVRRALVPTNSDAAAQVSGPNYDEFQSNEEIWELILNRPNNVLRVTMPHCDAKTPEEFLVEGSAEALDRAATNLEKLAKSSDVRLVENAMTVYSIKKGGAAQVGLCCMARIDQIRTADNPGGTIIRNEGIREPKARGRADLIQATKSFVGAVNNAVEDVSGNFSKALIAVASARPCDYSVVDEADALHEVWVVTDPADIEQFQAILASEPAAYVADGNHRSAAAGLLGHEEFLNVIFPIGQMGIAPYNRLVKTDMATAAMLEQAATSFEVVPIEGRGYEPTQVHDIGVYSGGGWHKLTPKPGTFDPANAAEDIDSDIVQRLLFDAVLNIDDPKDARLNFVGGNKPVTYLEGQVDRGEYAFAMTLAPVTVEQFMNVCRQNRFMPPKSTWFDPKVRSGLLIALLD